jgi:hypothetical protein
MFRTPQFRLHEAVHRSPRSAHSPFSKLETDGAHSTHLGGWRYPHATAKMRAFALQQHKRRKAFGFTAKNKNHAKRSPAGFICGQAPRFFFSGFRCSGFGARRSPILKPLWRDRFYPLAWSRRDGEPEISGT